MPAEFSTETIKKGKELLAQEIENIRELPMMPLNNTLSEQYAQLDPMGHYSSIDLDFKARMSKVEARMQFMPDSIQSSYSNLSNSRAYDKLNRDMMSVSLKYNVAEYLADSPAKTGDDAELKGYLNAAKDKYANDPRIKIYNDYVTQMEYLTGIRKEPPTKDQERRLQCYDNGYGDIYDRYGNPDKINATNPNNLLANSFAYSQAGSQRTSSMPEVTVTYTNSANWKWQEKIAEAHASQEPEREKKIMDNFANNNAIEAGLLYDDDLFSSYNRKIIKPFLDPFFEEAEANPNVKKCQITRDDLIFINGSKLSEVMKSRGFHSDLDPRQLEIGRNDIISSALQTGGRVNMYRVAPDGEKLMPEPITLKAKGHEPSPVNEPHFNAWEKFWSKHGFYKEKTTQMETFQRVQSENEKEAKAIDTMNTSLHYHNPNVTIFPAVYAGRTR